MAIFCSNSKDITFASPSSSSDSSRSSSLTNTSQDHDYNPTITGLAEAGSTVKLFNQSTLLGSALANSNGAFSITSWYRLNSQKNRIVSLGSKESYVDASDFDRLRESKEAYDWYENITKMIYS